MALVRNSEFAAIFLSFVWDQKCVVIGLQKVCNIFLGNVCVE